MTTYVNPGLDASGNGNNWTTNNINWTSSGVTFDTMTDVPTNTSATVANYATLNPLSPQGAAIVVSAGNLQFTRASTGDVNTLGTFGMSSGKWYWEVYSISNNSGTATTQLGIANSSFNTFTSPAGNSANAWVFTSGAFKANNNTYTSGFGSTWSTGDTLMIAFDADNGKVWFGRNGTWIASGDPAAGTNAAFSSLASGTYFFVGGINGSADNMAANFGQRPFTYTPPTGFNNCNTYNLPTPTIGATASSQANKYFDATLYTGNGSTQLVTNSGSMQPDFIWMKKRDTSGQDHVLQDSVRGFGSATKLSSSSTAAENNTGGGVTDPQWGYVTSAASNGFNITVGSGTGDQVNKTSGTYVGWNWKANGSGSSNTAGSITSTVSANTTSGFSIVTYTGTGSAATVGHGLGVAPKMVIVKNRNSARLWPVYHASIGAGNRLVLNDTAASSADSGTWNSTAPNSTVFYIGTSSATNNSGSDTYVAYCFAEVAGFSKFGSYTGNGSSDGTFVYTGFRPKYVLWKRTDAINSWIVKDSSRDPYNAATKRLYPDQSYAEDSGDDCDFLSNGFKMRTTGGSTNASGGTYIYMAFAESPFKYANAR